MAEVVCAVAVVAFYDAYMQDGAEVMITMLKAAVIVHFNMRFAVLLILLIKVIFIMKTSITIEFTYKLYGKKTKHAIAHLLFR